MANGGLSLLLEHCEPTQHFFLGEQWVGCYSCLDKNIYVQFVLCQSTIMDTWHPRKKSLLHRVSTVPRSVVTLSKRDIIVWLLKWILTKHIFLKWILTKHRSVHCVYIGLFLYLVLDCNFVFEHKKTKHSFVSHHCHSQS